jgi:hypothetical protein
MLTGSGIEYEATRERPELLIPRPGQHVWITVVSHVVPVETLRAMKHGQQAHLDAESIASVVTGCYICEQGYEDRLGYRNCPGEPR